MQSHLHIYVDMMHVACRSRTSWTSDHRRENQLLLVVTLHTNTLYSVHQSALEHTKQQ